MQFRSLLFVTALIPALAYCQGTAKLVYGSPGEREVWIAEKSGMPASTMKVLSETHDLPLPSAGEKKLFVWDRKTGNVAMKPVSLLKGGTWKLTPEDFSLVGKVTVRVEHEGDRVAVAFVNLKSGDESRDSQIDPKKNGEAVFFGIKPGNVQVTVRYNSNGQDADPAQQSFVVNLKRSEPDPTLIVSLSQPVETVGAGGSTSQSTGPGGSTSDQEPVKEPTSGKEGGQGEKAAAKPASTIGSILIYLVALGAAGALIWFGLRYMKENQDKVKDQLQKVGVQIPDPQDPAQQDPGPAPVPIVPQPPQKILLDDADPNLPPPSVPTTAAPVPSVSVSQPSLVMENGDVFPIPDGETSVGREAGNGLALVTESTVSRRHAVVIKNGAEISVRDEGSSNGTYVNGVKIASATVLKPGDQVQFGQVRFRYEA